MAHEEADSDAPPEFECLDKELDGALEDCGPDHAATLSSLMNGVLSASVCTGVPNGAHIIGLMWAAGRMCHKLGGTREKLMEIAGRAFDYSIEFDKQNPPDLDKTSN